MQRWLDSKKKGGGCHPGHPLCRACWRSTDKGIRVGLDGGRKQCKHQDFEDLTPLCKAFIEAEALMSRELGADDLMGHWMHLLETKVEALADLQDEGGLTPAQLSYLVKAQKKLKSLDDKLKLQEVESEANAHLRSHWQSACQCDPHHAC